MKKYAEVFWAPWFISDGQSWDNRHALDLLLPTPKPMLNLCQANRHGASYTKCPAFTDAITNVFVIQAPFDLNIFYDPESDRASINSFDQDFYDRFVYFRPRPRHHPPLLTLTPSILFYSNESVTLVSQEVPIIASEATKNIKHIVGEYNIGKWIRPIDWTFELAFGTEVRIKRGDPLFSVKFQTQNNKPVKLTRVAMTQDLYTAATACVTVKKYHRNLKLKEAYEAAKDYLALWRKNGS